MIKNKKGLLGAVATLALPLLLSPSPSSANPFTVHHTLRRGVNGSIGVVVPGLLEAYYHRFDDESRQTSISDDYLRGKLRKPKDVSLHCDRVVKDSQNAIQDYLRGCHKHEDVVDAELHSETSLEGSGVETEEWRLQACVQLPPNPTFHDLMVAVENLRDPVTSEADVTFCPFNITLPPPSGDPWYFVQSKTTLRCSSSTPGDCKFDFDSGYTKFNVGSAGELNVLGTGFWFKKQIAIQNRGKTMVDGATFTE